MKKYIEEIEKIQEEIDKKFGRKSDVLFYFVDLMEEVGELAEVIRAREFYKTEPKEDLKSELADIFYDLVGIAKCYGIDLEEVIKKRIEKLKERFLT